MIKITAKQRKSKIYCRHFVNHCYHHQYE